MTQESFVHFHPSLADPSEYKLRARWNPYLFKISPINGFQSSQTAIVENASFADAMNRLNCPRPGALASTERMSSLSPETQARPLIPCGSQTSVADFKYQALWIWLEPREERSARVAASLTLCARPVGLYRNASVHGISVTEIRPYLSWHVFIALITHGYGLRTAYPTELVATMESVDRYTHLLSDRAGIGLRLFENGNSIVNGKTSDFRDKTERSSQFPERNPDRTRRPCTRDRTIPGGEHHAKPCFAAKHALISFRDLIDRIDFIHRPDAGKNAEGERILRIDRRAGIPAFDRLATVY